MWIYRQDSGELIKDGVVLGKGYSGHGDGVNNPAMEQVRMIGPIPKGTYTIGPAHLNPHTGPETMNLDPNPGTVTYGRSLFRMHGDNSEHNESASEGCIIMPPAVRQVVAASLDRILSVI